jgi:uncharacterized phage-associated protein
MNHMTFSFAYRKATQALNFFVRKADGKLTKLKALKLVYFADRYHLRKFGRLLTNDEYFAMDYGPVPSGVKDLAEMNGMFLGKQEQEYAQKFIKAAKDKNLLQSAADVDQNVLSASEREALDFAWDAFGRFAPITLSKLTHHYPEWKRHKAAFESGQVSRVPIAYEDFLEEPEPGLNPCFLLSPEDKEDRRQMLKELMAFETKWN